MPTPRTRKTTHALPLAEFIYRHSPIKAGAIQVKDEDKPLAKFNKIGSRLYLGNCQAARDREFFKDKRIRAVLNCTKELPNQFAHNRDIEYMRIPVDDSLKDKDFELMYQYLPSVVEFIHKHANIQNNNVLIHCYAGRQRSAICVAAYLVAKKGMTPHNACKYILEKRPEAFHYGHSLNFDQTLDKYYKRVVKKG